MPRPENGRAYRTSNNVLEAALGKTRSSRGKLTAGVDRELLRTYDRMRDRLNGLAFVPVHEHRCTACKMQVAHQAYVALRRGDEILHCENCGRMLYWAAHFPDEVERILEAAKKRQSKA